MGVGGEVIRVVRLKKVEVNRNSFTRFKVARDGLACEWLDIIHCSRVFMDCLSAKLTSLLRAVIPQTERQDSRDTRITSSRMKLPVSSKNLCNAARATPTLLSFPLPQEIQTLEPMRS